MEKIWLKTYPQGIPAEIKPYVYSSIGDLFTQSVARHRDRVAYTNMGCSLTFAQVEALSTQFASYLQNVLRLPPGARVALMMPNCLQYPICLYGALRAKYVVVNCNPLYTPRELSHQLKDAGVSVIVLVENFAHTVQQALEQSPVEHVIVTKLGDLFGWLKCQIFDFVIRHIKKMVPPWRISGAIKFSDVLAEGRQHPLKPVDINPSDLAFLQYTGGTTGVAKGAMLSHGNLLANVEQLHAWIAPGIRDHEYIITALPLYHIFSLMANAVLFFKLGATSLLITNPRDITRFVRELKSYPFTLITGVNTLFNALMNHPEFSKLDFSRLGISLGGGMPVQRAVALRWQKITGRPLIEAYGLTETSPGVCVNPILLGEYTGAIGLPLPSTEIAIRDEHGHDLSIGQQGELCVRGPQVMQGYYNKPAETKEVMTEDGFLRTGDIAVVDKEGFVRLVDRKKDMILVSGFNVYPNEIEDVVASMPGVLEVAAVGAPDQHSGEHVKLFVVKKDQSLNEEKIMAYCRANLTGYKLPKEIIFRDELPKTAVGKILRRALRDSSLEENQEQKAEVV